MSSTFHIVAGEHIETCPASTLEECPLSEFENHYESETEAKWALAKNPFASSRALAALAEEEDFRPRVARNPSASATVLWQLYEETWLRTFLARNLGAPADLLERLAGDDTFSVRHAVAENWLSPPSALARLIEDEHNKIHLAIAMNVGAAPEVLALLMRSKNSYVRKTAATHKNITRGVASDFAVEDDPLFRALAALSPAVPEGRQERLATDPEQRVRIALTENPSILAHVLFSMLSDEDTEVYEAVSRRIAAGAADALTS